MPKYYRYGYQPYNYQAQWKGRPMPATQPAASTHELGDVTSSRFMVVPPSQHPYLLNKKDFERPPYFRVPRSGSPYYLDKYAAPPSLGASGSGAGTTMIVVVAAIAGALLLLPQLVKPPTRRGARR